MTMELQLPEILANLDVDIEDPATCPPARWGIIGPGGIARQFLNDARDGTACDVTAVASRSQERAEAFAQHYGIAHAYGSYEELVASDEIDVVYVATPHSEHHDHAILALEAGKPVLVEKAFTRNSAEARQVLDVARAKGLFVMEAMWSRFLPHMVVARAIVRSGALGDVVQVVGDHGQTLTHVERMWNPALAGGALLDLGVYPISFIHSVLGSPGEIRAMGHRLATGVDSSSVAALMYPDALGVATTNLAARTPTRAWIGGTRGRIDFDTDFYRPGGITVTIGGEEQVRWEAAYPAGGFQFQIAEVARCLDAQATESATMPWEDTIEVMGIMDEVRRQLAVRYPDEPSLRPRHPGGGPG
ncbi:MAG: Gfo/Idh/MocA family oxidoreductase [Actinomycetes bacterium]|nr:Gfo/Idh/MocA family oxidoreductase [Actinomycetes bacterium]MDX5381220.1 Gfo/Idh/MocA family oxidoreductase [Actinomycetes bacterium]MDX5400527.1 Gfo/Idh/MocA family oxidoreductase [Actinomycetes bacterium]